MRHIHFVAAGSWRKIGPRQIDRDEKCSREKEREEIKKREWRLLRIRSCSNRVARVRKCCFKSASALTAVSLTRLFIWPGRAFQCLYSSWDRAYFSLTPFLGNRNVCAVCLKWSWDRTRANSWLALGAQINLKGFEGRTTTNNIGQVQFRDLHHLDLLRDWYYE